MNLDTKIRDSKEELLQDLTQLLRIPSVSVPGQGHAPYGPECRKALDLFLNRAKEMGFQTGEMDGHCGWCEYGQGDEMVAVLAHLDVVPAGDGWTKPAFDGTLVGDRLYGRGTIDDKGPAIAALYALRAVKDSGVPLKRRVRILVGLNEEHGSSCMYHYVDNGGEIPVMGFTPDGMYPIINGEKGIITLIYRCSYAPSAKSIQSISGGTAHNVVPDYAKAELTWPKAERSQALTLAMEKVTVSETEQGLLVEARGVGTHGSTPEKGENAVGRLLLALNQLGLDGESGKAVSYLADKIGMETRGESLGIATADALSGDLTVNLGVLKGDSTGLETIINLRYPVTGSYAEFEDTLRRTMAEGGFFEEIEDHRPGVYMPPESPLVKSLAKVYEEKTGEKAELMSIGGGTYAKAVPNLVAFGPLFPGEEMTEHQPDEYILLDTLLKNGEIMAAAICELAGE